MFEMLTINKEFEFKQSDFQFNIPTKFSKESPIFTLNFSLSNNNPSVTINLTRELQTKYNTKTIQATFSFNEKGVCKAFHKYPEGYYFDGELVLDPESNESPDDNYCKIKIDYGKDESEALYIKGTFNLNDFKN